MQITTFNPLILTKDAEAAIAVFEALGFKRRHTKEGIGVNKNTDVRMKDDNGFYVDITQSAHEYTMIRINVRDLEEAVQLLEDKGFHKAKHAAVSDTVDTGSSKFNIMVSPTGYIIAVSEHIKNHD